MFSVSRTLLPPISFDELLLHAAFFTIIQVFSMGGWPCMLNLILATLVSTLAIAPIGLLGFFLLVSFTSRQIRCLSKQDQTVIGKPLLFPATLDHTRLSPIKNKFTFNVLFVGIPVGLSCRFGRLLSIDAEDVDEKTCSEKSRVLAWLRSLFSSWFSFDSARYLHRGDGAPSLQIKLHKFLKEHVCRVML